MDTGPARAAPSANAPTLRPAAVVNTALPVRSSTSSTTPTENISSDTRASVAALTKKGR
ncbi:MAG: hypothetical protein ACRDLA_17945 [Thermoleophilaceae bacterium]